ncbi:MAG: CDF family Co(II)/Ni(II) efflux transporter DmeF [Xanthobacteraceae bacterium]
MADSIPSLHNHVFLGEGHERNERRTWTVIALCSFMMVAEIVGGLLFGSIALIADGLHMSTHASALLLAALAYRFARRHVDDDRFSFGTGKFGDLAGFMSAIVLAMIALLIGYEALTRFIWPVSISFNEAIPIAALGLIVNVVSALLLSGGHEHLHGHNDHSSHHHDHAHADEHHHPHHTAHRDNNLRAAVVHVAADAAVSILVIVGLTLGRLFGWVWMDPAAGLLGAIVIATWAYTLIRDTGAILLDMTPDRGMAERMRAVIETDGDRLTDLHLWRLGPGHLGVIVSVATRQERGPDYYQALLGRFRALSHVTVEVQRQ